MSVYLTGIVLQNPLQEGASDTVIFMDLDKVSHIEFLDEHCSAIIHKLNGETLHMAMLELHPELPRNSDVRRIFEKKCWS